MPTSRPSTSASERSAGSTRSGSTSQSTTKSYREHEVAKEAKRKSTGSASAAASAPGSRPALSQKSKSRPTSIAGDLQQGNVERERSDSGFSAASRAHSSTHTPDSPSLRRKRASRDLASIASLDLNDQADGAVEGVTQAAATRRSSTSTKRHSLPPRTIHDFGPVPTPPPAESGQRCNHSGVTTKS